MDSWRQRAGLSTIPLSAIPFSPYGFPRIHGPEAHIWRGRRLYFCHARHSPTGPPRLSFEVFMARITVEDCLQHVPNLFQLVMVAAKRARKLAKIGRAHV